MHDETTTTLPGEVDAYIAKLERDREVLGTFIRNTNKSISILLKILEHLARDDSEEAKERMAEYAELLEGFRESRSNFNESRLQLRGRIAKVKEARVALASHDVEIVKHAFVAYIHSYTTNSDEYVAELQYYHNKAHEGLDDILAELES